MLEYFDWPRTILDKALSYAAREDFAAAKALLLDRRADPLSDPDLSKELYFWASSEEDLAFLLQDDRLDRCFALSSIIENRFGYSLLPELFRRHKHSAEACQSALLRAVSADCPEVVDYLVASGQTNPTHRSIAIAAMAQWKPHLWLALGYLNRTHRLRR